MEPLPVWTLVQVQPQVKMEGDYKEIEVMTFLEDNNRDTLFEVKEERWRVQKQVTVERPEKGKCALISKMIVLSAFVTPWLALWLLFSRAYVLNYPVTKRVRPRKV